MKWKTYAKLIWRVGHDPEDLPTLLCNLDQLLRKPHTVPDLLSGEKVNFSLFNEANFEEFFDIGVFSQGQDEEPSGHHTIPKDGQSKKSRDLDLSLKM